MKHYTIKLTITKDAFCDIYRALRCRYVVGSLGTMKDEKAMVLICKAMNQGKESLCIKKTDLET